jgi:hypothetical protein
LRNGWRALSSVTSESVVIFSRVEYQLDHRILTQSFSGLTTGQDGSSLPVAVGCPYSRLELPTIF